MGFLPTDASLMRILVWLVRAAIFFTLFAFALNNQQEAGVHWFFGHEWRAPMVFVVLTAFACGCAFGVVAMVPSWWRHRRVARLHAGGAPVSSGDGLDSTAAGSSADSVPPHPPRDGL